MQKVIDRIGQVMGTMKIISLSHQKGGSGNALWNAVCEICGYKSVVQWNARTKSGCRGCHGRKQMRHIKYKENTSKDLYMLKCNHFIKIGVTNNITVRLRSIQANCPYPVELVGFWPGEGHREKEWHEALSHRHHAGEWFDMSTSCEL